MAVNIPLIGACVIGGILIGYFGKKYEKEIARAVFDIGQGLATAVVINMVSSSFASSVTPLKVDNIVAPRPY